MGVEGGLGGRGDRVGRWEGLNEGRWEGVGGRGEGGRWW